MQLIIMMLNDRFLQIVFNMRVANFSTTPPTKTQVHPKYVNSGI